MTIKFQIRREIESVKAHLNTISQEADKNKNELGFLGAGIFEDKMNSGKLWVAEGENGEYAGHLMLGGKPPQYLKIFQIFVAEKYRGTGLASEFIRNLVEYAELKNCLYLRADVAADLSAALRFWQKQGFCPLRTREKENKTGRNVLIHHRTLSTPSLIPKQLLEISLKKNIPMIGRPLSYVLDLNAFFTLTKQRKNANIIAEILKAAFSGEFRLYVTPEFIEELQRQNFSIDPLLELAKNTLPVLPSIDTKKLNDLVTDLRKTVFPNRSTVSKKAINDESDLRHLAYCIIHSICGFITEEKAIIAARDELNKKYSLDVLPPSEFQSSTFEANNNEILSVPLKSGDGIKVEILSECPTDKFDKFIEESISISEGLKTSVLLPNSRGHNNKKFVMLDNELFSIYVSKTIGINHSDIEGFYLSTSIFSSKRLVVFDYIVDNILKQAADLHSENIFFNLMSHDIDLEAQLLARGFDRIDPLLSNQSRYKKVSTSLLITRANWFEFREKLFEQTAIYLPYYLPSPKAGINSKNVITASKSGIEYEIDTFSLESFVSPSRVLFQERGATILPISSGFSSQLLERQSDELPFPLSEEAIMRSEKVYYRNPSHSTDLIKGSLVIFYESGTTGRGLIGVARIINSEVMDSKTALTLYRRFGVLDEKNIDSYSNKSKQIQVLTFDNFSSFKRYIPFSKLRELGCGKANMVGPEKIDPEQLSSILHIGHEISSRDAIISIQPEYVAKIFSGKKTVELRRKAFPNSSNSRIWIYSTAPISSIVGTAIVTEIDNGTPDEIWNKYNSKCGISREQFDQYFDNTTEAFALLLSSPISFKKPISLQKLKDLSPGFTAPQYFRYVDHNDQLFDNLLDELNSKRIKLK